MYTYAVHRTVRRGSSVTSGGFKHELISRFPTLHTEDRHVDVTTLFELVVAGLGRVVVQFCRECTLIANTRCQTWIGGGAGSLGVDTVKCHCGNSQASENHVVDERGRAANTASATAAAVTAVAVRVADAAASVGVGPCAAADCNLPNGTWANECAERGECKRRTGRARALPAGRRLRE